METDNIIIRLVPEKRGLFLKHSEYEISTRKFGVTVIRRYNDFVSLHNLLLTRYPYRLLPRLPPKQLMLDSLLEERRRGLQRYLQIVCQHPILSSGPMLETFLTDKSSEHQEHLKATSSKELNEYSKLSDNAELPLEDQGRLASSRERMRILLNSVTRIKIIFDQFSCRLHNQSIDFNDMSNILKNIDESNNAFEKNSFLDVTSAAHAAAEISARSEVTQTNVINEKLYLLLDVLIAHSDLCDRVEKGIVSEHQKALSKMLTINKQKIKGVIRGSAVENVEALHKQELAQTGIVGTLGRKSAFSLQCVLQETSLTEKYLQILPTILLSFTNEQRRMHHESANIWTNVMQIECNKLNE